MIATPARACQTGATMTYLIFIGAALAEIAGCFAFWAWLRLDRSPIWLIPGALSLCLFAVLLTFVEAEHAGRTYAAYGGIYKQITHMLRDAMSTVMRGSAEPRDRDI